MGTHPFGEKNKRNTTMCPLFGRIVTEYGAHCTDMMWMLVICVYFLCLCCAAGYSRRPVSRVYTVWLVVVCFRWVSGARIRFTFSYVSHSHVGATHKVPTSVCYVYNMNAVDGYHCICALFSATNLKFIQAMHITADEFSTVIHY